MSFRHMYQDPQPERLLLVVLEQPQSYGAEYRHIRATVVRRAVPHLLNSEQVGSVATWNDDYPEKCAGYRNASWVLSKTSGVYVDDMQLRGQIDLCAKPLNGGRPYSNRVDFKPHSVCQNTARAVNDFYTKYGKFLDKSNVGLQGSDNFYVELCNLAEFLKITNVLFFKPGIVQGSLGDPNNFNEMRLGAASVRITEMLAP